LSLGEGMEHQIFAPCTRRKRGVVDPSLRASALHAEAIDRVARVWIARLYAARGLVPAEQFYSGRGAVEARAAAGVLGARLYFVSAGLGVVDATQEVPAYSLTVSAGDADCVASAVRGAFSPALWWRALNDALGRRENGLTDAISRCEGLSIMALPSTYLELIGEELAALPLSVMARVRLIGPPRGVVRPEFAKAWMPYDARFDNADGPNPGTKADFAQRAARHFAEAVVSIAPSADAITHAEMVDQCLKPLSAPVLPRRKVSTDAELIEVIRGLLPTSGGRAGATLRLLRHQAGRACEQGRFRRLFAAATAGSLVQ
jgi:hypothetical protein